MGSNDARGGKTIDMTLDGRVLDPPSRWTRLVAIWQALPRGAVPALLSFVAIGIIGAILLLGLLLVVIPAALLLGLLAMLLRSGRPPTSGHAIRAVVLRPGD